MREHRNFEVELNGKSYFTANVVDLQAFEQNDQNWDYDMTIVFNESNPIGPPEVVGYIYGQFDSEEELIKWLNRLQNDRYDSEQSHPCDWCGNNCSEDELTDTEFGKLCDKCIRAIRSRGEPVEIRRL